MSLIDLQQLSTSPHELQSDLLIVGAGISGLVLADAMRSCGRSVDVIEAGGETFEPESQELYDADIEGMPYAGALNGRFRVYGGSSTRWGGQLLPFPKHDYESRSHVPHSGWPIACSDLEPYLGDCQRLLGVNAAPFDSSLLSQLPKPGPEVTIHDLVPRFSKWAPFSCRNVAKSLGHRCQNDPFTRIFLHASVSCIDLHHDGRHVVGVRVRSLSGANYCFKAREVVIAAGAIETIRLMLASRNIHTCGIGNHFDQLGRWFHDHLSVKAAVLSPTSRRKFLQRYAPWFIGSTRHTIKFETSADWQAQMGCLNVMGHLVFESQDTSGFAWVRQQLLARQSGSLARHSIQVSDLRNLPSDSFDLAYLAWKRFIRKRRWCAVNDSITLSIDSEQQPNSESRICLSSNLDKLGIPKAVVRWQWGEPERRTFFAYKQLFQRQLQSWNLGPVHWMESFDPGSNWSNNVTDTYHQMGGTRMSDDPTQGIVDLDLKVHGIDNLFIASCSVFPTGGSSNPTLTLMQLTLRLAEHLKRTS